MASQTGKARVDWRRAIVGGVLAVGLMSGFGASTAFAQPAEPPGPGSCTGDDCSRQAAAAKAAAAGCAPDDAKCSAAANAPKRVNADQVLMAIHQQYNQGDGGGQISVLVDDAMKLRQLGFRPSNANAEALLVALDKRPNQTPLVDALRATVAYQRKLQTQTAMAGSGQGGSTPQAPAWAPVPGNDNSQFLPPQWDQNPYS
ncbi:hypothetical protein [Mycolicibacterium tusciae]|uniref:hypothetical protein n=1 Tax=Mycolicibacterium tusciae TaxID=75922 RepID=UPI00024A2EAC|nr:hypothetical protein [Mycolicibacterium tusciae]